MALRRIRGAHRIGRRLRSLRDGGPRSPAAASQAGGDLERLQIRLAARPRAASWRSPTRGCRIRTQRVAPKRRRARRAPRGRAPTPARPATSPAAPAAAPAGRSPSGPSLGTTRPGAVPAGSIVAAPRGTIACLRLASRSASGVEARPPRKARQDAGDLLLHPLVEDELPAGETGDHLGGQIVCRRAEAPAGDDQVDALGGEELERRLEVAGAVRNAEDVGDVDAQLAESLRDPGAVSIADAAGRRPRCR